MDTLTYLTNPIRNTDGTYSASCPCCGGHSLHITADGNRVHCDHNCDVEDIKARLIERGPVGEPIPAVPAESTPERPTQQDTSRTRTRRRNDTSQEPEERPRTVCLADVKEARIEWLWKGVIPLGGVSIIQGDPGTGKGTVTMDLAARVSSGRPMPCSKECRPPAAVILLTTAEDDLAATILPRLIAAGADCTRVHAFQDLLSIPDNLKHIEEEIRKYGARLVVIDPLNAYLGAKIDSNSDQQVRQALSPLKQMAGDTGAAVVLVRHMNKGGGGSALYRGGGSIGIAGAARSVFMVGENKAEEGQRVLAPVKANLSAAPPSLAFHIETAPDRDVPIVAWEGISDLTADELLGGGESSSDSEDKPSKKKDAGEFLKRVLANGPMLSKEVTDLSKQEGIPFNAYKAAKKTSGVKSYKVGDVWWMRLPDTEVSAPQPDDFLTSCPVDPSEDQSPTEQEDPEPGEEVKKSTSQEDGEGPEHPLAPEVSAYIAAKEEAEVFV